MYAEIFYHNFFINFLTALLFIIFNFYFSYSVSNIFNKNILFKENNPLLVFFLVRKKQIHANKNKEEA